VEDPIRLITRGLALNAAGGMLSGPFAVHVVEEKRYDKRMLSTIFEGRGIEIG
jgi:hypothetical protein